MRGRSILLAPTIALLGCGGAIAMEAHAGDDGGASAIDAAALFGPDVRVVCPGGSGSSATGPHACHDDRPPPGTLSVKVGSPCALPDGGTGIGRGTNGCHDPTVCRCKPEAGCAACPTEGPLYVRLGHSVCLYESCNATNQGENCALPDGQTGTCCVGVCRSSQSFASDANNCGDCRLTCSQGLACVNGGCGPAGPPGDCAGAPCAAGRVCTAALSPSACVGLECSSEPDGTPCAFVTDAEVIFGAYAEIGFCCNHVCTDPRTDSRNCGGCGITCCPGTQCGLSPFDSDNSSGSICQ
jgi:hypothetical protein